MNLSRSAFAPRHKNAPRLAEKSAPKYLQWLRGRECYFIGKLGTKHCCAGKIEAAHTRGAGDKGVGTKSSDRYAIPLCSQHHRSQHAKGWRFYENLLEFDAAATAEAYWRAWPGRIAWEAKNATPHS